MKSTRRIASALALVMCFTLAASSQETKKETGSKETKKPTANRLPQNYGKLGLTDAQKDKVYAIQDKHATDIQKLRDQLKAATEKRDSEIEAVLSVEQKKILKDLNDESKEKETTKSKSKKGETDKKSESDEKSKDSKK